MRDVTNALIQSIVNFYEAEKKKQNKKEQKDYLFVLKAMRRRP